MSGDRPDLALEVRLMRDEMAQLRETIDHLARRMLEREDRRTGEALLPLVADLLGGAAFTATSLAGALLNDRTPDGQAAYELIAEYFETDGGLRALGKLLARLDGIVLGGCRLIPAGERRDGRLWRVVRLSGSGNPQT